MYPCMPFLQLINISDFYNNPSSNQVRIECIPVIAAVVRKMSLPQRSLEFRFGDKINMLVKQLAKYKRWHIIKWYLMKV